MGFPGAQLKNLQLFFTLLFLKCGVVDWASDLLPKDRELSAQSVLLHAALSRELAFANKVTFPVQTVNCTDRRDVSG